MGKKKVEKKKPYTSLNNERYKKLAEKLGRGFASKIQKRLANRSEPVIVSETSVKRVLNNDFENENIQYEIVQLLEEREKEKGKVKGAAFDEKLKKFL